MGQANTSEHRGKATRVSPFAIGVAALAFAVPAFAQPGAGHASFGGHVTAAPSMSPGHSMTHGPAIMPSRSMGSPMGTAIHGGAHFGTVRPNSFGASSAPPPSWELPRTVTPHWEIGPNVPVQPNPVQGNRMHHNRGAVGVGYVGLPYYVDPFTFGNAWDWNDDSDTAQQAQPAAPAGPDYGPQPPYPQGPQAPYDEGNAPPTRAPYTAGAYPPPQQNSAIGQSTAAQNAAADDGLDHPPVTLVFNDGRPPVQVNSYVLTGTSVFIAEHGHQRVIPIADLDLPATVAQNREAGVDFALPGGSR